MPTRNHIADLLKGIAVILMVQVHIIELFATTKIYESTFGKELLFLGSVPVAPVFILIFGYYIASNSKSSLKLILKGLKIFGLGMLLNVILNLNLIISVAKGLYQIDLLPYIFGVDILQFAGLSMIVIALLNKVFEKNKLILICGILVSAFLGQILLNYIPENTFLKYLSSLFYGSTYWSYFPLFPWLAYPLTGMVFYHLQPRFNFAILKKAGLKVFIVITFLCFMLFTINYAISISSELQLYYHHGLLFFLWSILFLLFYGFFIYEFHAFFGMTKLLNYLKWLGKNVTLIYIIQWIIIGNIATEIYKTVSSPIFLLAYFVAILGFSSAIAYFNYKIKEKFIL